MLTEIKSDSDCRPLYIDLREVVAMMDATPSAQYRTKIWVRGQEEPFVSDDKRKDLLKLVNQAQGARPLERVVQEQLHDRLASLELLSQVLLDTDTNACTVMKSLRELAEQSQQRIEALEKRPFDIMKLAGEVGREMFRQAEANAEKLEKQKEAP